MVLVKAYFTFIEASNLDLNGLKICLCFVAAISLINFMGISHSAKVNLVLTIVEFLRKLRPGFEVPYVDPIHSVEECRIVSLFSNTGEADPRGYVWAGDEAAATRLLGLQYQLGLRPEWIMPWNAFPWFTPGEANGKLTSEQVQAGLKPLLALLKLVPRASAIVAHGTEANRLAQMLLKTDNPLIWRP